MEFHVIAIIVVRFVVVVASVVLEVIRKGMDGDLPAVPGESMSLSMDEQIWWGSIAIACTHLYCAALVTTSVSPGPQNRGDIAGDGPTNFHTELSHSDLSTSRTVSPYPGSCWTVSA